jgi:hypothetical protein
MFFADAPSASLFPHRKQCEWIDQGSGLMARVCDDGEVLMWHDSNTRETWLPHEQPPKHWKRFFRQHNFHGALGAAAEPGLCPPHPSVRPTPLAKIRRLQNALRSLANRVKDRAISVVADGLIGPHTVAATNRALAQYAPGFTQGQLAKAQIVRSAPQIAAYLERAPYTLTHPEQAAPFVATTPPMVQPTVPAAMPGGASAMPYYPPQPTYYAPPPGYGPPAYGPVAYGPPRGPGGLPADRASVDVKAFIPAQYEHVRVSPGTGMAVVAVGFVVVLLLMRDKKHHHKRED